MKAKVVSVEAKKWNDKDFYEVVFAYDGKQEARTIWWDGAYSTVREWQPDQEVEVEFTEKDGKLRFQIPKPGGGKGGGYKQRSLEEQLVLDRFQDERVDRRRALEQAVVVHGQSTDAELVLDTAGAFYKWLRKTSESAGASARTPTATGSEQGSPPTRSTPRGSPSQSEGSVLRGAGPSDPPPDDGIRGVESSAPKAAPEVFGEGANGAAKGNAELALELYGGKAHALRAARMFHDFRSFDDIDAATLALLIEKKRNPGAA